MLGNPSRWYTFCHTSTRHDVHAARATIMCCAGLLPFLTATHPTNAASKCGAPSHLAASSSCANSARRVRLASASVSDARHSTAQFHALRIIRLRGRTHEANIRCA
eukprot:gnl/Chilomastix_cuspidata/7340.p4 GENE.gnl/Chilomastix_cuspidata/7340~~gnl/Chilomastix_cuspidata/7340.p4  ORF type:complete len:106 (-),score=6.17 gnl/Chilomastix_cuspidata/7340:249-566(-)